MFGYKNVAYCTSVEDFSVIYVVLLNPGLLVSIALFMGVIDVIFLKGAHPHSPMCCV